MNQLSGDLLRIIVGHLEWHDAYINFICMSNHVYEVVNRHNKEFVPSNREKYYDKQLETVFWNVRGKHNGRIGRALINLQCVDFTFFGPGIWLDINWFREPIPILLNRIMITESIIDKSRVKSLRYALVFIVRILEEMRWL